MDPPHGPAAQLSVRQLQGRSGDPVRARGRGGAGAAGLACAAALALASAGARAQGAQEPEPLNDSDGYTPPAQGPGAPSPLSIGGYVDVGFAHAGGDGTSFPAGDLRLPADYGVDAFAPAVNSRGDVASTDSHGLLTNG